MKYTIEITETLQKVVEVEADSLSCAIMKAAQDYSRGVIMLDYNDFVGYELREYKEKEE